MICKATFQNSAKKYGHYASWAIWAKQGDTPKSNVGDLSVFNLECNSNLLDELNPNIVLVGLNISRPIELQFGNFHDSRAYSQDYKLRYAIQDTVFHGAYMTDIIKDFEEVASGNVMKYLKNNVDFEETNVITFKKELKDIGAEHPILVALGNDSYKILNKHFKNLFTVVKIPHYSMQISKENYRLKVLDVIRNQIRSNKEALLESRIGAI